MAVDGVVLKVRVERYDYIFPCVFYSKVILWKITVTSVTQQITCEGYSASCLYQHAQK